MIEVSHVTKRYGRVLANDDLSFTAAAGRITVLLGPNGAGKSTMIKCVAGLLRFEGRISIDGNPNKSIAAKQILGYVPEMPAVYDLLTVDEHMEFIARAYRLGDDWGKRADQLLERLEMDDKRKKLGKELSKGMQQKLSIACALLPEPRALILDEPLVGLDPHAIRQLRLMLLELRERGCALLISTHMLSTVEQDWDTAHIMMNGRIAATCQHGQEGASLEERFFAITEGGAAQ